MTNPRTPTESQTRAYYKLHSAREDLCLAQHDIPAHWLDDISEAVRIIDTVGSAVAPAQWSRHNQPEYPQPKDD
jgi:hypothetical protein